MYEYKSVSAHIPVAEETLNKLAADGWRLVCHCKEDEVFLMEREKK